MISPRLFVDVGTSVGTDEMQSADGHVNPFTVAVGVLLGLDGGDVFADENGGARPRCFAMMVGGRGGLEDLPSAICSVNAIDFKFAESRFLHENGMNVLLNGSVEDVRSHVVTGNVDLPDFESRLRSRVGFNVTTCGKVSKCCWVLSGLVRCVSAVVYGMWICC